LPDHPHQVNVERVMGDEIDNLKAVIEKKDSKILKKNRKLEDLRQEQTKLDQELKEAQLGNTQNQTMIAYLTETKEGLTKKLKDGQDELQKLQEDKQTYKNTVDFIVSLRTRIKKTFVRKLITLQTTIKCEQNKVSALQQALGRHVIEHGEKVEQLMQEKRTLEQRNAQLEHSVMNNQSKFDTLQEEHNVLVSKVAEETVLHEQKVAQMEDTMHQLREHIDRAEMTVEDQRTHYEANIRDLQERHDAKVSAMADQIERLSKKIKFLAKSPMNSSARTPMVSCSKT